MKPENKTMPITIVDVIKDKKFYKPENDGAKTTNLTFYRIFSDSLLGVGRVR